MRNFTAHFVSVSSIWCCTAILYTLFLVGTHGQHTEAYIDFYPWVALALLFYVVDVLLLRRGLSENLFVGLNVAMIAFLVAFGSLFLAHGASFMGSVAAGVFLLVPGVMAFFLSRKPLSPNTVLNFLEGAIVLFIVYVFMEESAAGSGNYFNIPLIAALVLAFVSIILMRTVSGNRSKVQGSRLTGGLMMAAIFVVILLISVGGLMLFSGGIRTALSGVLSGLTSLGLAIAGLFLKLMEFLAQFASEEEALPPEMEPTMGSPDGEMDAFAQMDWGNVPLILIGVIIAAVVVGIAVWMRKNKGQKLPAQAVVKGSPEKRAFIRNRLWDRIVQWIRALRQKLIFTWHKFIYRNTVPGILLRAEACGMRRKVRREKGESGSHYIRRLVQGMDEKICSQEDRILAEEFCGLLDRFFYSGKDPSADEKMLRRMKKIFR
ncbi:MAG: hypothetical protein E7224_01295 [Clostridiales bacterium]|nr:hypothetical protein [Clostridiales bacterium]